LRSNEAAEQANYVEAELAEETLRERTGDVEPQKQEPKFEG